MLLSKPLTEDPRVVREANALQKAGHTVAVLQWARFDPEAARTARVSGVPVVRFPLPPAGRLLPGTLLRTPVWWRTATRQAGRLHKQEPFDVVHAHDLDTLPVAVRLKRRYGLRLVYDAHEIFSYMVQGHVPWPVPQSAGALERRLLPHVDQMITAGDALTEHYKEHYHGQITSVHNALWGPPGEWKAPTDEPFSALYIGTLSKDRLFPGLVQALADARGTKTIIGGKKEGVYHEVEKAAQGADNVTFLGPVPHETVIDHTNRAHVILAPLDPHNAQYRVQMANKVYDAMAAGRPLISIEGTASGEFARKKGFGIAVAYDAQAVREAVVDLAKDPERAQKLGRTGHALAQKEFHWEPQAAKVVNVYRRLS